MTSTREPSDALEALEQRALDLARQEAASAVTWQTLRSDLSSLKPQGPPPLDPDAARQSGEELSALLRVLQHEPATVAPQFSTQAARAGYLIEGERGTSEARVRPAFAQALAAQAPVSSLPQSFSDLWAVDFELWRQLRSHSRSFAELALVWLSSPGRRLVQDLSVLSRLPAQHPLGASDFSRQRLHQAAGPLPLRKFHQIRQLEPWFELHSAVPGAPLRNWWPANQQVSSVLGILEGRRGDPIFLRGAALAWLLDRAADNPSYELEGLRRDLREDLPLSFISGFPDATDEARHAQLRAAVRLETVCLQHAARLTAGEGDQATERCWSVARWLQSCTFRSPFVGGDEESLTARLRALLPSGDSLLPSHEDVLDPGLLGEGGAGIDLAELALVAAAAQHYGPEASHPQLVPTPLPLVNALRRVAGRPLNAGEEKAEARLERAQSSEQSRPLNALEWEARHLAPPLVARWLMSRHRIAWLMHAEPEARRESLRLFAQAPARYEWVAFAVYNEGQELDAGTRAEAANSWRGVSQAHGGSEGFHGSFALLAAGVLDQLSTEEAQRAVLQAQRARADWRHRTLEALAEAAEKHGLSAPWTAALQGLLAMCEDESLEPQERLKAALLALRQASATRWPERAGLLQRLADVASRPPFIQNVALRRELRRLGLSPGPDSLKGAR